MTNQPALAAEIRDRYLKLLAQFLDGTLMKDPPLRWYEGTYDPKLRESPQHFLEYVQVPVVRHPNSPLLNGGEKRWALQFELGQAPASSRNLPR